MLVNVGPSNVQVDLLNPEPTYNRKNLHRPGKVVSLTLQRGTSKDILPFFDGDLEEAHKCVKFSKDTIKNIKPGLLQIYVCDDGMRPLNINDLLNNVEPLDDEPAPPPAPVKKEPSKSEYLAFNDLTLLKGVGPAGEEKLKNAGFVSIEDVANATLEDLQEVLNMNASIAHESAKRLVSNDVEDTDNSDKDKLNEDTDNSDKGEYDEDEPMLEGDESDELDDSEEPVLE